MVRNLGTWGEMTDERAFSAGSVFAGIVWAAAALLMVTGTVIGVVTDKHVTTMILMTHALFLATAGAALTMRQCAKANRELMTERLRMASLSQGRNGVTTFPPRR